MKARCEGGGVEEWHSAGNRGRVVSVGAIGQRNRQVARPAPD
ncbi:hypothetical protein SBRY_50704 [Actinacidiphila bryophytorum]|uniref:Uncharacterized protein n=1 Tax=Actinacidiphila bryophytorum TaxID=1436133 RepID=A0A9W4H5F8_9ACTN|nr:hypothetical protein SBRY_50704 [Actinacidiphila bryophytorum]